MRVGGKPYGVATSQDPVGYELRPGKRPRRLSSGLPDLLVTARAGIIVTGTEVLSGIIQDRNGPWLAERMRAARRRARAHDGRRRPAGRPARGAGVPGRPGDGPDRHLRRPRADRRRPHRARWWRTSRGARWRRRGAGGPYPRDPRAAAGRAGARRRGGVPRGQPQAGDGAPRARRCSSRSARPPGSSSGEQPAGGGAPGPAGRAAADVGTRAGHAPLRGAARARRRAGAADHAAVRHRRSPRSRKTLRDAEAAGVPLGALEITTCLRRGEIEIATVFAPAAAADYERLRGRGARSATATQVFARDGETIDELVARRCWAAGAHGGDGGVVHGRADGGAADRPRGLLGVRARRRDGVLQRGQGRAGGRARGADRAHGAVSPEVASALADGAARALRGGRRHRHHGHRRTGRRHAREAGRDRLPVPGASAAASGSSARSSCPAAARWCASGPPPS